MIINHPDLQTAAQQGAALRDAINHVAGYPLCTIEDGIGFILATIAGGQSHETVIKFLWSDALTFYDHPDACDWFLRTFAGDDPQNALWRREHDGNYSILNPDLVDHLR